MEVKAGVQKGAPRFREQLTLDLLASSIVFIWPMFSMPTMCLLVRVCSWVLGFYETRRSCGFIGLHLVFSLSYDKVIVLYFV